MTLADNIPVYCAYDEIADITTIIPNPRNPNKHSGKQIQLLAKIIKNQGWRAPITVSNRSGFIVRGHGRLLAAQLLGVSQVPVDRQDYTSEAEEWAEELNVHYSTIWRHRKNGTIEKFIENLIIKTGRLKKAH